MQKWNDLFIVCLFRRKLGAVRIGRCSTFSRFTDDMIPASPYWPSYLPRELVKPATTLFTNLAISAMRYGQRPAVQFFGRDISYAELLRAAEFFAGWLQQDASVRVGERVMLYMQNCPQWLMAYYGVLRADAVVVPVNPMNKAVELRQLILDCEPSIIVCSPELLEHVQAASERTTVRQTVVAPYSDYLPDTDEFGLPDWMTARLPSLPAGCIAWLDTQQAAREPGLSGAQPDDLALINYTSGSTGKAKGCMHTHQTFMHTTVGLSVWHGHAPGTVFLGVAPMYQVAGLTVGVNCCIYVGGTLVPMPRWDRRLAAALIARYRIRYAGIAPTAIIDMLSDPELEQYDLSSLKRVSFGGATMPDSVWKTIHDRLGLSFIEAYGMTETAATTHINPLEHPRRQCAGISFFDTDAQVVDTETLEPCDVGAEGEIVICGPQLFKGYWRQPEATEESFIELDGKRFFRTGDIGHVDAGGYFYVTDRVKRMINASGFKVWPAEVENALYAHPDILEVCVIGYDDAYRGESVKAVVVLRSERRAEVREEDVISWARERMAAYKYPRSVEFVTALPKSPVGKILWRELQDAEAKRVRKEA